MTHATNSPVAGRRIERLLFVYNADSGVLNSVIDSAKKILAINGCPLCSLTHSLSGEKSDWRTCKESLGMPVEYVHRNELTSSLRTVVGEQLPCVVAQADGDLVLLLEPDVIQRCKGSVADLRGRIRMHAAMRGLELPELERKVSQGA